MLDLFSRARKALEDPLDNGVLLDILAKRDRRVDMVLPELLALLVGILLNYFIYFNNTI